MYKKVKSKFNFANKLLLYKAMVLSVIMYGSPSPIWWWAKKCNKAKLQIIQNKFLKLICKVPMRYRTLRLHNDTNMKLIDVYAADVTQKYFIQLNNVHNTIINNL